jgi:hypothetical protein
MHQGRIVAVALCLGVALSGCARDTEMALTEWGTPCKDYGLSPKECHAKFADYAHYLAQPHRKSETPQGKSN